MITKILKYLVVVLITILGVVSIIFTLPFSRTSVDIDLGTIIIGTIFLVYAIVTLYTGSILMLISSFWKFPKKISLFLGVSALVYFLFVLRNLITFIGRGSDAIPIFIPLGLYAIASFRFFRKLGKRKK